MLCFALSVATFAHASGKVCDVRAFGAAGDGHSKDTAAIQKAIDSCAETGGTVRFTPGTYFSAPLEWKSHVRLQLDSGATLLGSSDMDDYPIREDAPWRRVSLLHADHATDIALTGAGIVDGNGQIWWTQQESDRHAGLKEKPRPMLFDLTHSSKIRIDGVTIQNSPQYNIMAVLCDGLTVRNVKILNPGRNAPNTDGIDPISSSHVFIEHDLIDTGDDDIAIKSGLVERGDPDVPSTHITIRNCALRNGHGLSIGSETAGGVRDVHVEHVTFQGTRQGIRIKSARGRGNDIGNFVFKAITLSGVEVPIQITAYYTGGVHGDTAQPMTPHTPRFHDFRIENVRATGAKQAAEIYGLPESPIRNLVLRHVHIASEKGAAMQYAQIRATDFVVTASSGESILKGPGLDMERK
ncbi:glycoside hydrolase family 28 protein [Silvibacterium dinghuense]|uniref:glycoside hydrolase family 28 protein n=1 Tax=Silvibacterium dinghuense TaxID=1560006 RepID=UPI0013E94E83|nr:glycoside hydrolase family 28 protein [Silvibacterium dinghuense]GGH09073.1 polygalacturonase [Silvibacterium dinghuense]